MYQCKHGPCHQEQSVDINDEYGRCCYICEYQHKELLDLCKVNDEVIECTRKEYTNAQDAMTGCDKIVNKISENDIEFYTNGVN